MERLPEHILSKIQSAKERRLVELDLSWEYGMPESDQLIKVPDQVFELENLATLKLKGNNLTELPPEIGRLTNLSVFVLPCVLI